jgi:hypothetical protein
VGFGKAAGANAAGGGPVFWICPLTVARGSTAAGGNESSLEGFGAVLEICIGDFERGMFDLTSLWVLLRQAPCLVSIKGARYFGETVIESKRDSLHFISCDLIMMIPHEAWFLVFVGGYELEGQTG